MYPLFPTVGSSPSGEKPVVVWLKQRRSVQNNSSSTLDITTDTCFMKRQHMKLLYMMLPKLGRTMMRRVFDIAQR
eukprot:1178865-Prorocentrum_minimum.AAC.2